MSHRALLVLAALLNFVSFVPAAEQRPNIVVILVDDLRWDAFRCVGHPFVKTPNIDRLAKEGATFTNCFVTTPLCSPSRASFLTGQYVHRHGVKDNRNNNELSHKLITFPRLLHDSGYVSAYVGKWHMGNDDSPRPGFDHWVSFKGQGAYLNPAINVNGKVEKRQGYITDLLNQEAVRFIKESGAKPFVLYLSHKAVHGPFTPAERHKELYSPNDVKTPPSVNDDRSGKPAITANADKGQKAPAKKRKKAPAPGRFGTMLNQLRGLMAIDEGVGEILKALRDAHRLDNTMVVFTSDNGYFWGEHGLGDKRWAYEESIRIPMFVRFPPQVKAESKIDALTLNIDLAPTILDLAGVAVPKEVQGRSLAPLFRGDANDWRKSFFAEYFVEQGFPRQPTWEAVRNDRWKYIHYPADSGWDELYDLRNDRYEMKNLVRDPQHQQQVTELKAELPRLRRARN